MRFRIPVRMAALLAGGLLLAGCGSATTDEAAAPQTLQFRVVMSSQPGVCTAAPLTSGAQGSACDRPGKTTYELGASLGAVSPTSAARGDDATGRTVVVVVDAADAMTLAKASRVALGKQLAVLLDGRVISAPVVEEAITGNQLQLAFDSATDADAVAAALQGTGSN